MDLLYEKYSNPLELIRLYINQGRFGEFTEHVLITEQEKRKRQAKEDDDKKLWEMYLHSYSKKSFVDWKKAVFQPQQKESLSMTNEQIESTLEHSRNILKRFNMR